MTKLLRRITSSVMCIVVLLGTTAVGVNADTSSSREDVYYFQWNNATDEERFELPVEVKAWAVGLTVSEFTLFSRVVESEADRSDDLTDRILVACTIINRVNDGRFGRNLTTVLTRPGQFASLEIDEETGAIRTIFNRTNNSDWAIIEAYRLTAAGEVPADMLYFNSIGFDRYRNDYCFGGGNYFSCETTVVDPEDVPFGQPAQQTPTFQLIYG